MKQIKYNSLRISTGRRVACWLFTKGGRVEFGTTEHKSSEWQRGGFEPGTSGLQVQRPKHWATHLPHVIHIRRDQNRILRSLLHKYIILLLPLGGDVGKNIHTGQIP